MSPARYPAARCLLILSAGLAAAAPLAAAVRWTALGPNGGVAFAVVPAPSAPEVLYAATAGGVFKSADGGRSWTALDRAIGRREVRALVIDPRDTDVLYAGTASDGVYKSRDGGATWRSSSAGLASPALRALAIDPRNPSILYAGTAPTATAGSGIFRSGDGGATWHALSTGILSGEEITSIAIDPGDSAVVYAAAQSIYKSADGGEHWTRLPGSPLAFQLLTDPSRPGTVFTSCLPTLSEIVGCALSRSADGGATWRVITPPVANPDEAFADLPLALGAGGVLYTQGWKSADAGSTWSPTSRLAALAVGLAADPSAPGTLYAATVDRGVYRTVDDAASWQAASRGIQATAIRAVAVDPAKNAVVFTGVLRTGLLRGRPPLSTWRPIHPSTPSFLTVAPSRPETLYVPLADDEGDKLLASTDSGATFRTIDIAAPFSYCLVLTALAVDPADPRILYAGGFGSNDRCDTMGTFGFKSADGGGTWTAMPGLHDPVTILVDPRHPSTLYALDSERGVSRSRDAGASWVDVNPTPRLFSSFTSLALDPTAPQVLYLDTDAGLYATADGGGTWHLANRALANASVILVDARSPQVLYAVIPSGNIQFGDPTRPGLYRSTDRGRAWASLATGIVGERASGALALDPRRPSTLYVGTDGAGLYRVTIDGPRP